MLGMAEACLSPSTQQAEAGFFLWVWGQSEHKAPANQGYTTRPCLNKKKSKQQQNPGDIGKDN